MNHSTALRASLPLVVSLGCTPPQGLAPQAQAPAATAHPETWPAAHSPAALMDARTEAMADALLKRLTVEEKVGQVIQADISSVKPDDLKTYPLGSVQAGGNSSPGNSERPSATAAARDRGRRQACCLASAGAEMSRVDRPMVIDTAGRLSLVLREVRLSDNEGDAVCPSR